MRGRQAIEHGIAAVEADADPRTRKRLPELRGQAAQEPEDAGGPGGVARPQQRGDEILPRGPIEGERGHQRQITPRVVEPIEERELLRAMRRVGGRIEVQGDDRGGPVPTPQRGDHRIGERLAQPIQIPRRRLLLKARERRL